MSLHVPDYVQIWMDGTERTDYVISYQRDSSLCEIGDTFSVEFSPEYPVSIDPYETVLIKELYDGNTSNVLRGYVVSVEQDFERSSFVIQGQDKSIRLFDYFVAEQVEANGESVDYWIEYFANLAGLNVQFQATSPVVIDEGSLLGMQTAGDAILQLERAAAYYTRYDSDLDKLVVFRLATSEPQLTINNSKITEASRNLGTDKTRNVVKVYGGYLYDYINNTSEQIFAQARTEMPELLVDKTVVIANPALHRQTYAYIVAGQILSLVNSVDDVQEYNMVGFYPDIRVGDYAYINVDHANYDYHGDKKITTISASVGPGGAQTVIIVGEKCNRISINLPVAPVYVTTTNDGVGISWDGGDTFAPSNIGLVGDADRLDAWSIAVNGYSRQMVITAAGLYRRYSPMDTWTSVGTLPEPNNEAVDSPPSGGWVQNLELIKVVEEPSKYTTFHVLASAPTASGDSRYWVYTTKDFGYNWASWEIWVPSSGSYVENPGAPSGRMYAVVVQDIESSVNNNVYVLASGILEQLEEKTPAAIYFMSTGLSQDQFRVYEWDGTNDAFNPVLQTQKTLSKFIRQAQFWTDESSYTRDICYVAVNSTDGNLWPTYYGSHTWLYRTNDGGTTWDKVHDAALLDTTADSPCQDLAGIAFDTTSDSDEVRCVIWQVDYTTWTSTLTVSAHFITHDPSTGTASYNEVNQDFSLDMGGGLLTGSEYFNGYNQPPQTTGRQYGYPARHTRGAGFAFGSSALSGVIRDPGPPVTATGSIINEMIFKFDFASETISEICQYVYRRTWTGSLPRPSLNLGASVDSSSVWALPTIGGTKGYIYDATGRTGSGVTSFSWTYRLESANTDKLGYNGSYPSFDLIYTDDSSQNLGDMYLRPSSNFWSQQYRPFENQFDGATTFYGAADSALGSDPDGFVSTQDGYTFTQFWDDSSTSPQVSLILLEFDWKDFE